MARQMRDPESTDIFRQKVTRKGVSIPLLWDPDPKPGEPYENVFIYGPFATRNVGGEPYMNAGDHTVKVEIQKLEAFIDNTPHEDGSSYSSYLEWVTEKEKVITRDVSELQ